MCRRTSFDPRTREPTQWRDRLKLKPLLKRSHGGSMSSRWQSSGAPVRTTAGLELSCWLMIGRLFLDTVR